MLRVSKLADYAVVVLDKLATEIDCVDCGVQTSPSIALATGVPEPTVAKVLKALSMAGLVTSQRGARGGYRAARSLDEISIAEVIAAIDGPIALTACVDGAPGGCDVRGLCAVHGRWDLVNTAIRDALAAITLADMRTAGTPAFLRTLMSAE
jgi:FeS assembly SUF system regulator